jgi:hypothetical protein
MKDLPMEVFQKRDSKPAYEGIASFALDRIYELQKDPEFQRELAEWKKERAARKAAR